jgi:DNA-directed RNA polymerase specialized sigma24 family protein
MADIPELTENEWHEFLERLTLHASWKFNRLGWRTRGRFDRVGPSGASPQDIALDAIVSIFEGKRQYNKNMYPDFYSFLKSIVDSKISHLYESIKNRKIQVEPMPQKLTDDGTYQDMEFESKAADPAQACINKDIVVKVKELLAEEFINDKIVNGILECLEAGITNRTDMAEMMGVKVKEIDNSQKRLRRAVDKKLQNLKREYER